MQTQENGLDIGEDRNVPRWMSSALASFDIESRMARRGLRVSVAVKVFGVGTLLANDLPAVQSNQRSSSQEDMA